MNVLGTTIFIFHAIRVLTFGNKVILYVTLYAVLYIIQKFEAV